MASRAFKATLRGWIRKNIRLTTVSIALAIIPTMFVRNAKGRG